MTDQTEQNDFAALNIGQLKNMASRAAEELRDRLPDGAGAEVTALVGSWASWLQGPDRDDFAAANVGQLKAVARPFYDDLIRASVVSSFPWSDTDPDRDDFAPANIGQLKALFAFDLDADSDGDWMRDVQETALGTDPQVADAHLDDDGDGHSNWEEMLAGTPAQSALAVGWQRSWESVDWDPLYQAGTNAQNGLGSTLTALATAAGGASRHALLRSGGFRFLVPDPASSFRVGFAITTQVPDTSGWVLGVDAEGDGWLRLIENNTPGAQLARIRAGDVITLSREAGFWRILLNTRALLSLPASSSPQRLVPKAHLRAAEAALQRCQASGLELDEDGDGIADEWELAWIASELNTLGITSISTFDPAADWDSDSVSNLQEFLHGLNPWSTDSDGDGHPDSHTVSIVDADGDGLPAHIETAWGLSDNDAADAWQDLDGDGLSNLVEYQKWLADPAYVHNHSNDLVDTDGDGMTDVYETHYRLDYGGYHIGLNMHNFMDATHDNDGDGVLNYEEAAFALDPFNASTRSGGPSDFLIAVAPFVSSESLYRKEHGDWDDDTVPDWKEHFVNQMARDWARQRSLPPPAVVMDLRTSEMTADLDGDGILTATELANNTNPLLSDTDGDGLNDLIDSSPGTIEAGYGMYPGPWAEVQLTRIGRYLWARGLMLQGLHTQGPYKVYQDLYLDTGLYRAYLPDPETSVVSEGILVTSPGGVPYAAGAREAASWFLAEANKGFALLNTKHAQWTSEMYRGYSTSLIDITDYGTVNLSRSDLRLFHAQPLPADVQPASVSLWSVAYERDVSLNGYDPEAGWSNPFAIRGQWQGDIPAGRSIAEATAIPAAATVKTGPETLTSSYFTLANFILMWEDVPAIVPLLPGATQLTEGFPGLHPANRPLHNAPLESRETSLAETEAPIVTITAKGTGQVKLWAIVNKGNPHLENRVPLPLSTESEIHDLTPLFDGLNWKELTFWIEPLQPGHLTLTYRAQARHNAAHITQSFPTHVALLPVEIVQTQLASDGYNVQGGLVSTTTPRLARWQDAWESDWSIKSDFISSERDRVKVRVPSALYSNLAQGSTPIVKIECAGDTTRLEMTPSGGFYESEPFLLVADADDDLSYNGKAGLGEAKDGKLNDQTIRAGHGHPIHLTFENTGSQSLPRIEIGKTRESVHTLQCELVYVSEDGSVPAQVKSDIEYWLQEASETFSQIGITLSQKGEVSGIAAPPEYWQAIQQDQLSYQTSRTVAGEEQWFSGWIRTKQPSIGNFVRVFFVPVSTWRNVPTDNGPSDIAGLQELKWALVCTQNPDKQALILAHEVAHYAGQKDHADGARNLMHRTVTNRTFDYLDGKRFRLADEQKIKDHQSGGN